MMTHDFITLDSCDDPSVWTPTGQGSISLNTTDYKQGSGAINIYKTGTAGVDFGAYKTIPATNLKDKIVVLWLYIKDSSTLSKINVARVYIYDSAGNYDYFDIKTNPGDVEISPEPLKVGWNVIRIFVGEYDKTSYPCYNYAGFSGAHPDVTAITKIAIYFETPSATDTIAEGSLVMDYWHAGTKITVSEATWDSPLDFDSVYAFDRDNAIGAIEKLSDRNYHLWCAIDGRYLGISQASLTTERGMPFTAIAKVSKSYILSKHGSFNPEGYREDTIISSDYRGDDLADLKDVTLISSDLASSDYDSFLGRYVNVEDSRLNVLRLWGRWGSFKNCEIIVYDILAVPQLVQDSTIIFTSGNGQMLTFFSGGNFYFRNVVIQGSYTFTWMSPYYGTLYIQYSFDLTLTDSNGNPISGATVTLYDANGNQVFQATTDANGNIPTQWVTVTKVYWSGSSAPTITSYNPFRLLIVKDSMRLVDYKMTITGKTTLKLAPYITYFVVPETSKPYYLISENVVIKARVLDWNNTPITGLTVNATITKPDGTQVTISLKDDGVPPDEVANDGVYTGAFTETDQVGTYFVEISTTIYGNIVKARASFDVGSIEKKIDEAKTEIESSIAPRARFRL